MYLSQVVSESSKCSCFCVSGFVLGVKIPCRRFVISGSDLSCSASALLPGRWAICVPQHRSQKLAPQAEQKEDELTLEWQMIQIVRSAMPLCSLFQPIKLIAG